MGKDRIEWTVSQVVRVPEWSLGVDRADYYGWRWAVHVGMFLIFFGRLTPLDGAQREGRE